MPLNVTEATFESWSNGPSQTESDKCDNAVRLVKKALADCPALSSIPTDMTAQGSYYVRTNVRQNSDVDVCVKYGGTVFFPQYDGGTSQALVGNVTSPFKFADFKNAVGTALINYFGQNEVTKGKKAFTVHENSYRIDADVIAVLEHRRYTGQKNPDGSWAFHSGVQFIPDNGGLIINWPEQTYANGVARNTATSRYYKRTIRILKRLRDQMQGDGIAASQNVASFLIECLVYNVPVQSLLLSTYVERLRAVLTLIFQQTLTEESCKNWLEVSEMKWLFRDTQPWSREQANNFARAAWNYIGFE